MTINPSLRLAGVLAILVSATACKHQNTDTPTPALVVTATTNPTLSPTIVPIINAPTPATQVLPEFTFDWENAQYVPNPAGVTPVPTPWSDQAKRAFSDDFRYDHKKADGWEMVYSTFSSQRVYGSKLILLYNKYRGLLRTYYYESLNTDAIQDNNILIQQLEVKSASPLLNFAEQPVIDVAQNSTLYTSIEPQAIATKTWYAVQYEIAFDAKQASQRLNNSFLDATFFSDQITSISLNSGKALTTPPIGLHLTGVSKYTPLPSFNGRAQLLVTGTNSVTALQNAGQDVREITNSLMQPMSSNLLSGIIYPQGASAGSLLPYTAIVQLSKPTNRTANLESYEFVLPGSSLLNTNPLFIPQYNEAPGVFYLDSKPVITAQTSASACTYTLDVASVRYLFNPAVTNLADIKNLKQEIVATAIAPAESTPSATPTFYSGTTLSANQPLTVVGVRVSFDVVPRSGAAPVHIIKTFKADVKPR